MSRMLIATLIIFPASETFQRSLCKKFSCSFKNSQLLSSGIPSQLHCEGGGGKKSGGTDTRKLRTKPDRAPAGLVMGRHGQWSSTKPITRYCKSPCIMCLLSKPRAALCFLNTGQELILIISTSNQCML